MSTVYYFSLRSRLLYIIFHCQFRICEGADYQSITYPLLVSRRYDPEENFDENGALRPELKELLPPKHLRMGQNPFTNPKIKPLILPEYSQFGVDVKPTQRGQIQSSDMYQTGKFLAEVIRLNESSRSFRMFGPDETASNRLQAVYEVTKKQWMGEQRDGDDAFLAQDGRLMEVLSEHLCEGMLEGYILSGGHGLLNSYEAFIHIISSMFNQHAKWLEVCNKIAWRNELSSLNIILSSHVWRQDHNGFTHQDPGFLQHVATKKPEIVRIYLPPDTNCLLATMHHCLATRHKVNVVVAGKHPAPQWLSVEEAAHHCQAGIGIWEWASNDKGCEPDVVLACAGDVPTLEALAAAQILRTRLPKLRVRFVNVVDVMRLSQPEEHPHGLSHTKFDAIFAKEDIPVLFNFHAYPLLIDKLVFDRKNDGNFKVNGYKEEGTITTPFDMAVLNGIDRYNVVKDVCDIVMNKCRNVDEETRWTSDYVRQDMSRILMKHRAYICEHGVDIPEVLEWEWKN